MGFGAGKTSLTKRKTGDLTNSTKSCRIELNQETKLFDVAYSYQQKIAVIDHERKVVIYNDHKYSNTTSYHQSAVRGKLSGQNWYSKKSDSLFPDYRFFLIDVTTLNHFNFKTLSSIEDRFYNYTPDLPAFLSLYFGQAEASRVSKKVKEIEEKRETEERESKNRRARLNRLETKIKNLDYKTGQALEKAITKYKEENGPRYLSLTNSPSLEVFESFLPILKKFSDLDFSIKGFLSSKVSHLEASPEKIKLLIKELKETYNVDSMSLGYSLKSKENLEDYFEILDEEREFFEEGDFYSKPVYELVNRKKALEVFGGLDNEESTQESVNQEAV